MPTWNWWNLLLATGALCASCRESSAQPGRPGPYGGVRVADLSSREQWRHERDRGFERPWATMQVPVFVDSIRVDGGGRRTHYVTIDRPGPRGDEGRLVVAADGRVEQTVVSLRDPERNPYLSDETLAGVRLSRLTVGNEGILLPSAKLWDLVPTFHPRRAQVGARWTDPIDNTAEQDGFRQRLRGTRTSRIVGDTIVGGRRRWIVRDSARVVYEERWRTREYSLDSLTTIERRARGTIHGEYVLDDSLNLFEWRADTTALVGTAVLRYVDGRNYQTAARFERVRQWRLYPPADYAARQYARQDSAARRRGGPARAPSTGLERRLAAGDTLLRDSLATAWHATDDWTRRDEILGTLRWAPEGGDPAAFWKQFPPRPVAAGDLRNWLSTAGKNSERGGVRFTLQEIQRLVEMAERPGWLFEHGLLADEPIEKIAFELEQTPPAATPDTANWPCEPEACRFLAGRVSASTQQRVRDLGLLAALVLDPRRWADTVRRRAGGGSSGNRAFFAPAMHLVTGVGATWESASQAPLPAPGAEWRAWLDWLDGRNPRYPPDPYPMPRPPGAFSLRTPRFEKSHANAIRFASLITSRDIVGELRARFAAEPGDSARLVFGTVLAAMGQLSATDDQLADHFRSGSPVRIAIAKLNLGRVMAQVAWTRYFEQPTMPRAVPDSAIVLQLLDRVIAIHVAGAPTWRAVEERFDTSMRLVAPRQMPMRETRRSRSYLLASGVPRGLQEKWKASASALTEAEWLAAPQREAADIYTISPVERLGPFVILSVRTRGRIARPDDASSYNWASGDSYVLLEIEGEWYIVSREAWIT